MKHILTLLTALLLAPPAALHAADFHVATNGSDTNPGSKDKPFKTISAGVAGLKAGDTLLVGPGVYRETIKVTRSGAPGQPITIAAEKKGTVTIRGSALVTGWRRSEENSKMFIHDGWDKYFGKWDESLVKGGDQFKAKFGGPGSQTMAYNQVFLDGTLIREVACPAKREAGTFYIDREKKQIHVWLANDADPNKCRVEVTDRDVLLQAAKVSYLHVKGLNFEHCASANQFNQKAAVNFRGGNHNLIEDCTVQHTSRVGLAIVGDNNVVRRCVMNHNGQQGFASSSSENVLIEDSETSFNNQIPWKRANVAHEAGGFKVLWSHKVKFLRHTSISNYGPGLWFDMINDEIEVANCYAANNRYSGVTTEISYRIHVHDSVFINNKNGVVIAESPGALIERNIMIGNENGVYFRDMLRTARGFHRQRTHAKGKDAPIWNHDEVVRNNVFLNNKKVQISFGIGGINANRQVPQRLLGSQVLVEQGKKRALDAETKLAADYVDKKNGLLQPEGLYLEKLNFVINGNVYWGGDNVPLMQWGNLLIYRDLTDLRAGEGFEKDGAVVDPQFADWKSLDLRVPADSPLLKRGCYPHGEVPGVKLGIINVASAAAPAVKWHPGHYIYVGHGEIKFGGAHLEHMLEHFRGVQRCYAWTKLEPEKGRYDFSSIRNDLALLKQHGKQLVIQIQYKAFLQGERFTPSYIRGPEYGGGVFRNGMGAYDPVMWNSNVGERMDALYAALGRAFDSEPGLEAAVLPETSPCHNLEQFPQPGVEPFTTDLYVAAIKKRMLALRKAFPNTAVIQYVNYPQQALPQLTDYMKDIGVGMGGPDVYPRPSALSDPEKGIYRLYPKLAGTVPLGAAVQSPDYSVALWKRTAGFQGGRNSAVVTAEEEIPIPARDFLKLAQDKLKLNYLFWSSHPPSCFENVKKLLAEPDLVSDPAGGLATQLPSKVFLATASETNYFQARQ